MLPSSVILLGPFDIIGTRLLLELRSSLFARPADQFPLGPMTNLFPVSVTTDSLIETFIYGAHWFGVALGLVSGSRDLRATRSVVDGDIL